MKFFATALPIIYIIFYQRAIADPIPTATTFINGDKAVFSATIPSKTAGRFTFTASQDTKRYSLGTSITRDTAKNAVNTVNIGPWGFYWALAEPKPTPNEWVGQPLAFFSYDSMTNAALPTDCTYKSAKHTIISSSQKACAITKIVDGYPCTTTHVYVPCLGLNCLGFSYDNCLCTMDKGEVTTSSVTTNAKCPTTTTANYELTPKPDFVPEGA